MKQKIRKSMIRLKGDDIDRLYVSRKGGGRGLANIENYVETLIRGHEEYIKKSKERLIIAVSNNNSNIRTDRKQNKLKPEKRNGKKNNCMNTSSDKMARVYTRKPGSLGKLNLC